MNSGTTEVMRKSSSESPPLTSSFSSLPNDVALNIVARISRIHYLSLSLVSRGLRSLIASRELYATRALIGNTENCIYLCLNLPHQNNSLNPNPRWFKLQPTPKHKLLPVPSFPYQHPKSPTVVPMGSEIYIIGGFINGVTSEVFLLDCRSHQWPKLQEMHVPRGNSAVGVFEGKIYVVGGCESDNDENWGEIYDPKTQTWNLWPTTTPDLC